jgi:hypothetical protein
MKPGKKNLLVQPLAHKDMHELDDQQLESLQGGVSPVRVLEVEEISTSRDSSGPSWITRSKTPSPSIPSSSSDPTSPSSPEVTSRPLPTWVEGSTPFKRRRIS